MLMYEASQTVWHAKLDDCVPLFTDGLRESWREARTLCTASPTLWGRSCTSSAPHLTSPTYHLCECGVCVGMCVCGVGMCVCVSVCVSVCGV